MAEVKRRARRSRRAIAKEREAKETRRVEREGRAAEKKAAWEADYPRRAAQYKRDYDARLTHESKRAGLRRIQEAGVDWLMGYDTPAAKWFKRYVDSNEAFVKEKNKRTATAGDPLNITGHTPLPSKKLQRRQAEADRIARGEYREVIPDLDNPRQNVLVTALAHSFRRMKRKLETHQQPAAERFLNDWESAGYTGLSSQGFDPKVDSSAKATAGHLRAAEAQTRLKMAERQIGQRNYQICVGVVVMNVSASEIHALGGRDHRTVSNDIDVALNALTGFYDPIRLARDPTWRAFQKVIEVGMGVIRQGEEEVR